MHETNKLIRTHCAAAGQLRVRRRVAADARKDGTPKPELFVEDGLHMTPAGYTIWTAILAPHLK